MVDPSQRSVKISTSPSFDLAGYSCESINKFTITVIAIKELSMHLFVAHLEKV